jgi:hypothetical protein
MVQEAPTLSMVAFETPPVLVKNAPLTFGMGITRLIEKRGLWCSLFQTLRTSHAVGQAPLAYLIRHVAKYLVLEHLRHVDTINRLKWNDDIRTLTAKGTAWDSLHPCICSRRG